MKTFQSLLVMLCLIALISCEERCSNKTLIVDDSLLRYVPYENEMAVSFTSDSNETISYTVTPSENTYDEDSGNCINTTIQQIAVFTDMQGAEHMRVWLHQEDDPLHGERDRVWTCFELPNQDSECGSIIIGHNPPTFNAMLDINGRAYVDVITANITASANMPTTLYLSKDVGLVGYEFQGETWALD